MANPQVVLDVMGGDHAPAPALHAASVLAAEGTALLLCGPPDVVGGRGLEVLPAAHWIGMAEDPVQSVRARPDASIRVAARAVADGRATAMVSAGSTGATMAAVRMEIGRQRGVRRPVLAARIPTPGGDVVLVDVGATTDGDADALVRSATLGVAHAVACGVAGPTVALLNMGSDAHSGPRRVRDAAISLRSLAGFRGSIEPDAVLAGDADVVVTDGFTGNVLLKVIEACQAEIGGRPGVPAHDAAATVLGVRGTVLVAHGSATGEQLAHAVRMAAGARSPLHTHPGSIVPSARDRHGSDT